MDANVVNSNHCGPFHTNVIIVGNGPSAISLSFLLSGNRPYYDGTPLSDEYLTKRLQENSTESLLDQDLEPLCEGLEGRSNNPVALLFDKLFHPDADLGDNKSSVLDWRYEDEYAIPHVVLGKTLPGGTWQKIDGSMQTISQNSWMELPTVPFREWLVQRNRCSSMVEERATIADVKEYYCDYVKQKNLQKHFKDFHTVTSVQPVYHLQNTVDDESGEVEPCCQNVRRNHSHCWEVRGYHYVVDENNEPIERHDFCYVAPHVVLATGAYDIPNRLGVEGENLPLVVHNLGEFEKKLSSGEVNSSSDPILVVGAGLSAADVILMALEANIPVIHLFRRGASDPSLIFSKLPHAMYPEYHRIHSLMKGREVNELYQPFARHMVVDIMPNKVLVKSSKSSNVSNFDISCAAIMIGSKSDLRFLHSEGKYLGVVSNWQIDSKHNVMNVDPYSYQSLHEPYMYGMGPLVGDNFVRFGIGGALGIVNYLTKTRRKSVM